MDDMDPHGSLMGDYRAMTMGIRVDLRCIRNDENGLMAATLSTSFPTKMIRCDFPTWTCAHIVPGTTFTMLDFVLVSSGDRAVATGKHENFLPIKHLSNDKAPKAFEAFAGIGGWSCGAEMCGMKTTLYIECDTCTALACAKTHNIPCMGVEEAIQAFKNNDLPERLVLCADITRIETLFMISVFNASWGLMSPPCQPWSKAGSAAGFASGDGKVMAMTVVNLGILRASGILMENVPGFPEHCHFRNFKSMIRDMGWLLVLSMVDKVAPLLPVVRNRWMGLLMPGNFHVDRSRLNIVNNTNIPNDVPTIGKDTAIGAAGCFQHNIASWEKQQCMPDEEAIRLMGMYELLPANVKSRVQPQATQDEIRKLRVKSCRNLLPNVMAMTGSQHTLPMKHLRERGLHAYLIQDGEDQRYPMPYEIALAMGYPQSTILPADFQAAWRIVGNGLTPTHAALMSFRTHVLLGEQSPFQCEWISSFDLCRSILACRIQFDDFFVHKEGEWMELRSRWVSTVLDSPPTSPGTQFVDDDERSQKDLDCSPTWRFGSESEDEIVPNPHPKDFPDLGKYAALTEMPYCDSLLIKMSDPMPFELWQQFKKSEIIHKSDHHAVSILHDQGIWGKCVFRQPDDTIRKMIKKVLPHANRNHFEAILFEGHEVNLATIPPDVQNAGLIFTPHFFMRVVQSALLRHELAVRVDLTWTFNDLIGYVAVEAGVYCANQGHIRFAIRDPKWGSVRTIACDSKDTIDQMLRRLLPNFQDECLPLVMVGDNAIKGSNEVAVLLAFADIQVHFPSARPWPNSTLEVMIPFQRMDVNHNLVQVFVKSPYDLKPKAVRFPEEFSLCRLAAFFVDCFLIDFTLMVLIDGKSVDTRQILKQIDTSKTIQIRVCALPGGAKNQNKDMNEQLSQVLAKRGVPSSDLAARAKLILSKMDHSELRTVLAKEESTMWTELKSLANTSKVRLITAAELKTFQKDQRSKLNIKKQPKAKQAKNMDPLKVSVDIGHFIAADEPVAMIDFMSFGPDMKGIALATPAQAEKFLPATTISADPLALLILTSQSVGNRQPVLIPAKDQRGNPILTPAILINFGDQEISCLPNVPRATVQEVSMATLEIKVIRSLVPNWDETKNHLNYLGKMLPEVRTGQVISTWAMRFYTDDRKVVDHSKATYLHGYMRIPFDGLETILRRSGKAGLFVQSKSADHRHDPAYAVLPLHGQSIDEVLKMAATIPESLGVVTMGASMTFAIRSRREHLQQVRRTAMPQSILPQEGVIKPGSTWYLLKSLKTSTTCEVLADALKQLGWNAEAIKPTGPATWLVSAQAPPPSGHLIINDQYVAVVALGIRGDKGPNEHHGNVPKTKTNDVTAEFSNMPDDIEDSTVTTSSRFSDLRVSLEDQVNAMIGDKLKGYDKQIQDLRQTMVQHKSEADANAAAMQAETKQVASTQMGIQDHITQTNTAMMKQMQSLFSEMQTSLSSMNGRLDEMDPKRHKSKEAKDL
eukprot:Skav216755  [mRNA]  locus=scaffold2717:97507:102180:- [translate_table: standard]